MATEKSDSNLRHLCIAIADGKVTEFRRFLKKAKKTINATVTFSRHNRIYETVSPLFLAVNTNQEMLVRELLDIGANPNDCGPRPPLVAAIRSNNEVIVDLLLAAGAQVNCYDLSDGSTPLHAAPDYGNMTIIKKLLDRGANINAPKTNIGTTPLIIAIGRGFDDLTQMLIAAGADITIPIVYANDKPAENALTQAILGIKFTTITDEEKNARFRILSTLLAATDPIKHEQFLNHSLKVASLEDPVIYYRILNTFKNKLPQTLLDNLLVQTIALQNLNYVQDILIRGANPNYMTSTTESVSGTQMLAPVIYIAAQNNQLAIVRTLYSYGADPNQCASNGESPLFVATVKCYELIVRFLLSLPTITLNQNISLVFKHPLCGAIIENHIELIDLLLNHEQLKSMTWKKQNTIILSLGIHSTNTQIITRLLMAKFSPLQTCNFNISALAIAVCENQAEAVSIMLKYMLDTRIYKGIFLQEMRSISTQLLEIAYCFNSKETARVLIKYGIDPHISVIDDPNTTIWQWLNPPLLQADIIMPAQSEKERNIPTLIATHTTFENKPTIPFNYHTNEVTLTYSKRRYLQEECHLTPEAIDVFLAERNKEKSQRNRQRFFVESHKLNVRTFSWFNHALHSSLAIPIENSINCFLVVNSDALFAQDCPDDQIQRFKSIRPKFDDDHIKKIQDDGCVNQAFVINRKVYDISPTHELRDPTSIARILLYPFLCDKGKATLYVAAKYLPAGLHKQRNIKSLSQQSRVIYLEFRKKSPQFKG